MAGDSGADQGESTPDPTHSWLQSSSGEGLEEFEEPDRRLAKHLVEVDERIETLRTDIDRVDQQLNGLEATLEGRIDGLDSSVDALRTKLRTLEGSFEDIDGEVQETETAVDQLEERAESMDSVLSELIDDVEATESQITETREELNSLESDIRTLGERLEAVAGLDETVAALESDISTLRQRVDETDGRVESLSAELTEQVETLEDRVMDRIERAEATANAADDRVGSLKERLDEQIEDVRERVIQIKREVDAKAPDDHDHPELAGTIEDVVADLEELSEQVSGMETAVEDELGGQADRLDELEDATEDVGRKLNTLATATVTLRKQTSELIEDRAANARLTDLLRTANREGVSEAECENCGEDVDLGTLGEPVCPHCQEPYNDLRVDSGFFRTRAVLETGPPPALDGEVADEGELTDLVDEGDPTERDDRA